MSSFVPPASMAWNLDHTQVCTDVIGHDVIFAETKKFDGTQRRDLYVWEAAQVAGSNELPGMLVLTEIWGEC